MKNFKITDSPHGILLYPVPVDKARLFLIQAKTTREAKLLKYLLDAEYLHDPVSQPELYLKLGLHIDQQTFLYELKWTELSLEFLPKRHLDFDRAKALEKLMSKKISKLPFADKPHEVVEDILFRLQKQKECSECDRLGVNESSLDSWFQGLRNIL